MNQQEDQHAFYEYIRSIIRVGEPSDPDQEREDLGMGWDLRGLNLLQVRNMLDTAQSERWQKCVGSIPHADSFFIFSGCSRV